MPDSSHCCVIKLDSYLLHHQSLKLPPIPVWLIFCLGNKLWPLLSHWYGPAPAATMCPIWRFQKVIFALVIWFSCFYHCVCVRDKRSPSVCHMARFVGWKVMRMTTISTYKATGYFFPEDEDSPGLTIKHRTSKEREVFWVFFSSYQALGSFTAPFNFSFQHSVNRVNVFSRQYYSQKNYYFIFKNYCLYVQVKIMLFHKFVSEMK